MGRRKKRNNNTRRKRLYEARMRGSQNALLEEAKLVSPYTLKGLTMMSIAEMEEDQLIQKQKRADRQKEKEGKRKLEEEEEKKKAEQEKVAKLERQRVKEEEKKRDEEYAKIKKPNYWEKKNDETTPTSWWNYLFGY